MQTLILVVSLGFVGGILWAIHKAIPGAISKTVKRLGEMTLSPSSRLWASTLIALIIGVAFWGIGKIPDETNLLIILVVIAFGVGYLITNLGLWLFWHLIFKALKE